MAQTSHNEQTKWVTEALLVACTLHLNHRLLFPYPKNGWWEDHLGRMKVKVRVADDPPGMPQHCATLKTLAGKQDWPVKFEGFGPVRITRGQDRHQDFPKEGS